MSGSFIVHPQHSLWVSTKDKKPTGGWVCLVKTAFSDVVALGSYTPERDIWTVQPFMSAWYETHNGVLEYYPHGYSAAPEVASETDNGNY